MALRYDSSGIATMLDENGNLLPQFKVGFTSNVDELNNRLSGINLNTDALKKLREIGLSEGPSKWADLQTQSQKQQEMNAATNAATGNRGATAAGLGNLARSGGLSSGARERLQEQGSRDLAMGQQNIANQGIMARLGIASQDEQNKLGVLSALPGQEVQALQPQFQKASMWAQLADSEAGRRQNLDLANTANTLGVKQNEDAARLKKYEEDMKAYAADQSAKAQAQSGGGGGKK